MSAVGDLLLRERSRVGLSQRALAEEIGARDTYISQLEHGQRIPAIPMLIALAETLGTDVMAFAAAAIQDHRERAAGGHRSADEERGYTMTTTLQILRKGLERLQRRGED